MKRFCFVLIVSALMSVSCDKDEDGMYLSPNYCTATINGEEYAYQDHYTIPMMWGNWPDADYQTHYAPAYGVKIPLLNICTPLLPLNKQEDSEYFIRLYIKDFKIDNPWAGQTYNFTCVDFLNVDKLYEAISQENINIAMVEGMTNGEIIFTSTASGSIRFSNHEEKWCDHEANKCFEIDFTLKIEGKEPIEFTGHLFTRLKY